MSADKSSDRTTAARVRYCDAKGCANEAAEKVPDSKSFHVIYGLCSACAAKLLASRIQVACDRCTQGVMDSTNPHLNGACKCQCHEAPGGDTPVVVDEVYRK